MKAEWEVEKVSKLLCTNNPAERPFAVAKAYMNIYGRIELSKIHLEYVQWLSQYGRT